MSLGRLKALLNTASFIRSHPLTRDHPVEALSRFVRWQVGSRLLGSPMVYRWIGDTRVILSRGESGLTGNLYCGLHEFADMAFVLHAARPEDLFLDIGANVGAYTLLASGHCGARAHSFEPVPATFERLRRNLALNDLLDRVTPHQQGLGALAGSIAFTTSRDCTNHALAPGERADDAVDVPVTRLDDAVEGETPTLLKIDVEGFETEVVRGGRSTLSSPSVAAVIMELNGSGARYGHDEQALLATMLEMGYQTFRYDPWRRALIDLEGRSLGSGNTLFVRDAEAMGERLANAPSFRILGHEI